jgi:hypothetical protein
MEIKVNAAKALAAFNIMDDKVTNAIEQATREVGMVTAATMKRQIVGGHSYGSRRPNPAPPPKAPMNITGNLRRQIRPVVQKGFRGYSVMVGSFASYARQLELGGGRWREGVRYPFIEPTARIMNQGGRAQNIYIRALSDAIKKSGS